MFTVIPAIDLLDGKVVRLTQGNYDQVQTYTHYSPAQWAKYFEDNGATRIHIVDLNGAKSGKPVNMPAIEAIRKAVSCTLELGGGIRHTPTVAQLIEQGIDYIILGSLLTKEFALASAIIEAYPHKIIAGLDAKNMILAVEGWLEDSKISVLEIIKHLNTLPLNAIIYTDIDKDGTLSGPNLEALVSVANHSKAPVIASGGVGEIAHIQAIQHLHNTNIAGCIVGKAALSGKIAIRDLLQMNG